MNTNNSIQQKPAVSNRIAGLSFLKEAFWVLLTVAFVVASVWAVTEWLKVFYHVGSYYIALIGGAL
jgi:hypothetical protein